MARLSPDVIRSWEKRYNIVEPQRDASGARFYSDADIARLTLAREATRLGHPIRRVALLSDEQLRELVRPQPSEESSMANVVACLLGAIRRSDVFTASHTLRSAALMLPARELVLEVLAPALREVGRQWQTGELAIWQEHVVSTQILSVVGPLQQTVLGDAGIVFATPPYERHGFGIALAALLCTAHGVRACNLGVMVPASQLADAARHLHAQTVVVGMTHDAPSESEGIDYIRELRAHLPQRVEVILGGETGARIAESHFAELRGVATLEEFDTLCPQWQ